MLGMDLCTPFKIMEWICAYVASPEIDLCAFLKYMKWISIHSPREWSESVHTFQVHYVHSSNT